MESIKSMRAEFRTVDRDSNDGRALLLGRYSRSLVALPVETWDLQNSSEKITFRLVPRSELKVPSLPIVLFQVIRWKRLSFFVFPMLSVFTLLTISKMNPSPMLAFTAFMSVVFFQISAWLLNDFEDHMQGLDRVHQSSGSRIIQKGWMKAFEVRQMAYLFFGLAVGTGLPHILSHPFLAGVGLMAALVTLFYSKHKRGVRSSGLAEVVSFLIFGPLLIFGYSAVLVLDSSPVLTLGKELWPIALLNGLHASLTVFLIHFAAIFYHGLARIRSLPSLLGFDRSRLAGLAAIPALLLLYVAVLAHLKSDWRGYLIFCLVLLVGFRLIRALSRCKGPLSSQMLGVRGWAESFHFICQAMLWITLLMKL